MSKRVLPGENIPAEPADAHALRALHAGTATSDEQQCALKWILSRACDVGGMPWHETDRETSFALGRLFVGKQIGRLLVCDLSTLRRDQDDLVDQTKSAGRGQR